MSSLSDSKGYKRDSEIITEKSNIEEVPDKFSLLLATIFSLRPELCVYTVE